MEISPRELRDVEIAEAWRGYHRDVVNDLLERAAATIEAANERVREMSDRVSNVAAEAGRSRETEDILHRTLLLAQRAADEAVAEAQQRSRQMVEEAELQARKMLAESEGEARRRGETERRRLEEEILELASRRDALLTDVEALTRFENEYRERMARALEADLAALRQRSSTAPGPQPEPHDVDLPSRSDRSAPAADVGADPGTREDSGPETREVDVSAFLGRASPQPVGETPAPAAAPAAAAADAGADDERAAGTPVARPIDVPPRENSSIDLLGDDALEAEVLDDDAFFATLREAVHDDSPLGPREHEDDDPRMSFFDQEDEERASFRDVFRRRR